MEKSLIQIMLHFASVKGLNVSTELSEYRDLLFERYRITRTNSEKMHKRACRYLPGGDTRTATYFEPYPHFIDRGEGAFLFDIDGNKLVDFQNNYTSLIHGHAHKPTADAVSRQMKMGTAYSSPFELQIELAQIITERFENIDLVRFANSGTEANMQALRIARAFTGRMKILKNEGAYHGSTDVFEASVDPDLKKAGTPDNIHVLPDSMGVSPNALKDVLVVPFNDIERTEDVIKKHKNEIACMIIEPILGSAGQVLPETNYLKDIRELTKKYDILLIFDEIVTGRLSTGGAQKYYDITPDLTSLGKIIGGGTSIGAFGGREDIMSQYDPRRGKMYHSGTFNGNAVVMAAGIATMRDYDENAVTYVNRLGSQFKTGMQGIYEKMNLNIQINGIGSIYNILFTDRKVFNYRDVARSHENLNKLLNLGLLINGVFNAERGMFCMSTAMTEQDIDFALKKTEEIMSEMLPVIEESAPELICT